MSVSRRIFVLAPAALWAASLAAQESDAFYARINALSGFEIRAYLFDPGLGVTKASQWHVPLAFVTPLNRRLSLDLSASYASTTLETTGGDTETITGFTDTQLRLLYTLQPDRLVASLVFNLPTGQRSVSQSEFAVTSTVGSNFLSFPVSGLGTAVGVTGGLAYAARAGSWNVGLAGSARYLGPYEPFSDVPGGTYTPGLEGRLRAGVDRLLGARTRFLLGAAVSTYSVDEFAGTGASIPRTSYKGGPRLITDVAMVHVAGTTTFSLAAWDYYRFAGSSNDTTAATQENVFNVELRAGLRAGPRVQVTPMVAFRQYNAAGQLAGRLYSGGASLNVGLSERLSAQVAGRFDSGWASEMGQPAWATLTGYGASVLFRFQR
jgi:hypothetical protein